MGNSISERQGVTLSCCGQQKEKLTHLGLKHMWVMIVDNLLGNDSNMLEYPLGNNRNILFGQYLKRCQTSKGVIQVFHKSNIGGTFSISGFVFDAARTDVQENAPRYFADEGQHMTTSPRFRVTTEHRGTES
eukprot:171552-Amphidinium_carterae.1